MRERSRSFVTEEQRSIRTKGVPKKQMCHAPTGSSGAGTFDSKAKPPRMPRFAHTSIFVNDMKESIEFYTEKLGLRLLDGPFHYPGNADMAFVGRDWNSYIELVYDLEDHAPYSLGNRYEHLAIEADGDLTDYVESLRRKDVKVIKDVYKSPGGRRAIAFVEDPNGIPVELLEPR
jgi:lactoylglutathione lyase